jgi:GNAT superfamily N-acetyltransferase
MGTTERTLDGTTVVIRPIEPSDAAGLVAFHEGLAPETVRLRFFNLHPHLSDAEVDRCTHVDHVRRESLVALIEDEIVGVARHDRCADDLARAEVAIVVADRWQLHGIGTLLLERLEAAALEAGVTRWTAETLPENSRMRHVFRDVAASAATSFEDGVVRVDMALRMPHRGGA